MEMVLYMLHDLSVVDLNRTCVLQSLCVKLKRSRDLIQLKSCCLLYDIQLPDAMDVWHHLTTVLACSCCWANLPCAPPTRPVMLLQLPEMININKKMRYGRDYRAHGAGRARLHQSCVLYWPTMGAPASVLQLHGL
jgi:hypothetical protein